MLSKRLICINFNNLKNQGNLFLKVQQIKEEKEINEVNIFDLKQKVSKAILQPILLKFTVVSRIDIDNCNKRSITLICHDTIICKYIYCRVLIFDCQCLEKIAAVQCGSCQLTEPY